MKNKNSLENLFHPQSIAIVGATEKEGKVGNVITKNILSLGYAGEVYLVNPSYTTLFGRVCFPDLTAIPDKIDLAIIVVPAKAVSGIVEQSAGKIKNYVIISAGFSEIGETGLRREGELIMLAKKYNLNILGPNCLGFIVPQLKLNASFAGGMPEQGKVALVSQSGALAVAFMDIARREKIGFSQVVSVGNKLQVDEAAMLDYLAQDPETQVVGMYLEGIKDGPRFLQSAAAVAKAKPVVLLKAGKTEKSQKAIASHTGALAGSDEIISAVCRRAGIIRAEDLENFLDILKIFSCYGKLSGGQVVAVTNAGGPGVLATDAFKDQRIRLADISEPTKVLLRNHLPEESSLANPIDMLGDADEVRYRETLKCVASEKPDAVLAILTPQDQTPVEKIADEMIAFKKTNSAAVVASFVGGARVDQGIEKLAQAGIPNFPFPERAVAAIGQLYPVEGNIIESGARMNLKNLDRIDDIITAARNEDREALYFSEAAEVMGGINVPIIESVIIRDENDLKKIKKYPAVIKVDSDQVLHKTDQGGLVLDIPDEPKLREAWIKMKSVFSGERIIVQPMVSRKIELIIGMKRDEAFGPVVVVGLGGIYTEIFKTVDFFLPPGGAKFAENWLMESRIGFLFTGARGEFYDPKPVAEIIAGIGQLCLAEKKIISLDINPLLIYNDGRSPLAVDVKVLV